MFFKEVIVILSSMYCFWRNTPIYPPTYLRLIPNILKKQDCKIFTKLVPSQTNFQGFQK